MKSTGEKFRQLKVAVFSKESRVDDCLGNGKVEIVETLKTGEFDGECSLSLFSFAPPLSFVGNRDPLIGWLDSRLDRWIQRMRCSMCCRGGLLSGNSF